MGIDLGGGFGAGGAVQGLQQLIAQRQFLRQYDDQQRQQQWQNDYHNRALAQADELKHAQIDEMHSTAAERARVLQAAEQDRQMGLATHLGDQIPSGVVLPEADPAVGIMQKGGLGSLLTKQPAMTQGVPTAFAAVPDAASAPEVPTTPAGFLKGASANQAHTASTEAEARTRDTEQQARDAEAVRHNRETERTAANKPPAMITVNTVDANGQPVTKVVPKTAGAVFPKGPSAVTQNRLDSAKAVQQTGEDIIRKLSDPAFKAAVGPMMGRVSTLRDFIGNPPPEFAELAGQIESYALANIGVHGMRSAQGAQQIAHLLDQHHTPESLIAAVNGLNGFSQHFLENAGRGTTTPKTNTGSSGGQNDPLGIR